MPVVDNTTEVEPRPVPPDTLRIAPYAVIGRDGTLQEGLSEVDEAPVTGEVVPIVKRPGDRLHAGSRNGAGSLIMVPDPSRPPAPAMAVPVLAGSALVAPASAESIEVGGDVIGPFLVKLFRRIVWIDVAAVAAAAVWVTLHPGLASIDGCSLILVGLMSPGLFLVWPLQRLALRGWLKAQRLHCRNLDRLCDLLSVRQLVFGRVGTLSQGRLRIVSLQPAPGTPPAELVTLAISAYQNIEDAWGRAFLAFGLSHRVHLRPVENVQVEPGRGLSAAVADKAVVVGRAGWLEEHGIAITGLDAAVDEYRRLGRELLFAGIAGTEPRCLGVFALADPPRAGTSLLIRTCKKSGLETCLIGDPADIPTATLAGLTGVGRLVPAAESGDFDQAKTLVVGRSSDVALLRRYDNAIALGQSALQMMPQISFGIGREDTRHVLDFIVLAQVVARRLPVTFLLVWASGWPLAAEGFGLLGLTPLLRFACIGGGIVIALVQSQLLRLIDSLANDEHED
ncbi:MAG TPA: hypothetical protein VND94_10175 [Terriglobia bacterium]|nr:hypothetical protein [Terriglobia bacterium]